MSTGGPSPAPSMRPPQSPLTPVPATPLSARPGQAATALSRHPKSRTQRSAPPSKVALVLSWVARTKLYLGAAIGILTLIVTIVSLLPSFAGDRYGKEALELALWTARKDYVEACRTYLNHTNIDCQHALEKGLPPPPGLDRFAARSLQKLKDHVQWLEIQPLTHETDNHVVWLRLWLLTGTIVVALTLTGYWNRFIRLVRRQRNGPYDRAIDLASNGREQEGIIIGDSQSVSSGAQSQASSTARSVNSVDLGLKWRPAEEMHEQLAVNGTSGRRMMNTIIRLDNTEPRIERRSRLVQYLKKLDR
ncbi:hypothetical protein BDR22DRAFT_885970 [Usnea florida]